MSKEQVFIAKANAPWFNNYWKEKNKIAKVDKFVSDQVTCKAVINMGFMFYNCFELISLDASKFDTSKVEVMIAMFGNCYNLTSVDLSNFDTSKITNMADMFQNCYKLTALDLSSFDTSNVTIMHNMFDGCSKLTSVDLSNFDTSNVTNMYAMFYRCSNLTTIKGVIDMKSCEDYYNMFHNCHKLKDVEIKNPPPDFEVISGLSKSQYTIVS